MKKIISTALGIVAAVLVFVSGVFFTDGIVAEASRDSGNTKYEQAYNFGTLTPSSTISTTDFITSYAYPDNWYKFTLDESGIVDVGMVYGTTGSTSSFFEAYMYAGTSTGYAGFDSETSVDVAVGKFYGNGTDSFIPQYLDAGVYYIKITKGSTARYKEDYTLRVTFTPFANTEGEYNSLYGDATDAVPGVTYRGNTYCKYDKDWFRITLASPGYVDITVKPYGSDAYLGQLYCSDGTSIFDGQSGYYSWDFKTAGTATTVSSVGLDAGTYYFCLRPSGTPTGELYDITFGYTATEHAEREQNGTADTATEIQVNTDYRGATQFTTDDDYYKFTLTEPGYVTIRLKGAFGTPAASSWRVSLRKDDGTTHVTGSETHFWYNPASNDIPTSPEIGLGAGTYYILLEKATHTRDPYDIRVNFTAADNWEREDNSSRELATDMGNMREWYGSTSTSGSWNSDESDYFKFWVNYTAGYTLTFSHPDLGHSKNVWQVYLYLGNNTEYTRYSTVKGNADLVLSLGTLTRGTYYLRVIASAEDSPVTYKVSITDDHAHAYAKGTDNGDGTHTLNCTVCGGAPKVETHSWNTGSVTTRPTCTEGGIRTHSCTACSAKWDEPLDPKHTEAWETPTEATCTVGGMTGRRYCSVCNETLEESKPTDPLGHIEGSWIIDGEATCTVGTTKHTSCTRCGETVSTETVDPLGHYESSWIRDKFETCEEDGLLHTECVRCHETLRTETPLAFGHDDVTTYESEPTCEQDGERRYRCINCGRTGKDTITALGHDYVLVESVEVTCGHDGYDLMRCNTCGESSEVNTVPATGEHDVFVTVVEPTCTEEGYERHDCRVCGGSWNKNFVPVSEHAFGEWLESGDELRRECESCGTLETKPLEKEKGYTSGTITTVIAVVIGVGIAAIVIKKKFF